jgi:hypothetical protein
LFVKRKYARTLKKLNAVCVLDLITYFYDFLNLEPRFTVLFGHFGKYISNTLEVSKCGAGEG